MNPAFQYKPWQPNLDDLFPGRRQYRQLANQGKRKRTSRYKPYKPNQEPRYFDSSLSASAINETTGWAGSELDPTTLNTLFCPVEGNDINNRHGRKVGVYKIAIRGVVVTPEDDSSNNVFANPSIRLILYQDTQTNGGQAQAEEVMDGPGTATAPLTFSTFQSLEDLGRYKILKDMVLYQPRHVTQAESVTGTVTQVVDNLPFKMTVKFKTPVVVKFNSDNAGTVGDIVDNSFHLIGHKSGIGFTSNISYQFRGYYKDF